MFAIHTAIFCCCRLSWTSNLNYLFTCSMLLIAKSNQHILFHLILFESVFFFSMTWIDHELNDCVCVCLCLYLCKNIRSKKIIQCLCLFVCNFFIREKKKLYEMQPNILFIFQSNFINRCAVRLQVGKLKSRRSNKTTQSSTQYTSNSVMIINWINHFSTNKHTRSNISHATETCLLWIILIKEEYCFIAARKCSGPFETMIVVMWLSNNMSISAKLSSAWREI
jgi:hypothetical protein